MTWKQVFTSSVGRKLTMGLTGIFLILFLLVHAGLNACIWANDGGAMFNRAANFMGSSMVPRVLEIGLFVFIFLHAIQGLMLEASNRSKRDIPYQVKYGNRGSKWYSRSMAILGILIFLFLILHWYDFFIPSRFGQMEEVQLPAKGGAALEVHDLYGKMFETFSHLWVVIAYVIGCIALAYHLAHGFQSSFRSLGVYNKKYNRLLIVLGYAYAIIIPLAFILMPVSIYFGWIQR